MDFTSLYKAFLKSPLAVTDSRAAVPGSIFFALKGERFDGNRFAADALDNGSLLAVIDDPEIRKDDRYFLVDNVLDTLQQLAAYHRKQLKVQVLAVTGSNGKTTTKELIKACLSTRYSISGTEGNLNNHIGVPLTLLRLNKEHEMAVIEMGANHPGEIASLCKIADPDFGIITNIGRAHIEGFGSYEGVRKAKGELYDYLGRNHKTIFVNGSDAVLVQMSERFAGKVLYFGNHPAATVSGRALSMDPFLGFELEFTGKEKLSISSQVAGSYNLDNFLTAACVSACFNVPCENIKHALENYNPGNMRSQVIRTASNLIFLDSYNANPSSMEAAISSFREQKAGSKVIILGEMLELGAQSVSEHEMVLKLISTCDINKVFLVGKVFMQLKTPAAYTIFNDSTELAGYLEKHSVTGSSVLIKGSRLIALEKVVPFL